MKEKNILIACNSLDYILIEKTLGKDFHLQWAQKREDIIRGMELRTFDLFLLDISFLRPGFEILRLLKSYLVPVVVLSSEPEDARNTNLLEAGCCACYIKPIRQEVFVSFIHYWIDRYARAK